MTDEELHLKQLLLHLRRNYPDTKISPDLIGKCNEYEAYLESKKIPGYEQLDISYDFSQWPKIGI